VAFQAGRLEAGSRTIPAYGADGGAAIGTFTVGERELAPGLCDPA
jgi:hypothetical protein